MEAPTNDSSAACGQSTLTDGLGGADKHELQQMIDSLMARDKNTLDEMNGWFGGGPTLENQVVLADGRAMDALVAVCQLARYIMALEKKVTPNAKLCGEE